MIRWVVGAALGAVATVVVASFGVVVILLTAWSPVEDEELDWEDDEEPSGDELFSEDGDTDL